MTDKEIRKLKRIELIEMLYYLKKENEELAEENKRIKDRLYELAGEALKLRGRDNAQEEEKTVAEAGTAEVPEAEENGR